MSVIKVTSEKATLFAVSPAPSNVRGMVLLPPRSLVIFATVASLDSSKSEESISRTPSP